MLNTFLERNKYPNQHFLFGVRQRDGIAKAITTREGTRGTDNYIADDE